MTTTTRRRRMSARDVPVSTPSYSWILDDIRKAAQAAPQTPAPVARVIVAPIRPKAPRPRPKPAARGASRVVVALAAVILFVILVGMLGR